METEEKVEVLREPFHKFMIRQPTIVKVGLVILVLLVISGFFFVAGVKVSRIDRPAPGYLSRGSQRHTFEGGRPFRGGMHRGQQIFGTVVSTGSNQFSIKTNGGSTDTVTISDNTQIIDNGSTVSFSNIKSGQQVAVSGTISGSQLTAISVLVNPPANSI